ncbi:TetR/AcrR family transcriptional regulator C-terminal domain-containing protein [Actinomadura sp. 21ATH]|uniref:TetR/AcrR family transcriptional regulator C-terminal domain-containing protein n=1 Tax=Actinomadura sp. 21ATH TaxID=1735444 RepID=UPI0035C05A3D
MAELTGRGRVDKRRAILDAAFAVFARDGYAQAGVDVIAAEAGVAKATVYNHFGDKETLLRATFGALAESALERNLAAVERLRESGEELEEVGFLLARCYCDERSRAMRRLLAAEAGRFPDLLDIVQGQVADRVAQALADRLARLSLAGRLRTPDPLLAAEQFLALLTGPAETRSRLGTRDVPDEELRDVAKAAARTFLAAFSDVRRAS